MTIYTNWRWIVPIGLLGVAALAATPFMTTAAARPLGQPVTPEDLVAVERARGALRGLGALHIRASAALSIERASGHTFGAGAFDYWELGDRYRIASRLDPAVGLGEGTSIAYDGTRFAYYDKKQNILSYNAADTRNNPTALPNPIFLMLDFLDRSSQDGCIGCRLRLADLDDDARWLDAMSSFRVIQPGVLDTVRITPAGDRIIHRVVTTADHRIVRIEREDDRSGGTAVIDFDAHDDRGLPHLVTVTAESDAGVLRASFMIEALEAPADVEPSVFSIDDTGVRAIWDSDTDTFLKAPGWDRSVSMKELIDLCRARKAAAGGGLIVK